nr:D-alanyl-D-alanine carboxypeptidase family protein [uncultured Bacillus sp.]
MKRLFVLVVVCLFIPFNAASAEAVVNAKPEIVSESAMLMDTKSGAVLFEKNADMKMVPASLTKIATAIYAIETGDLNEVVTVSKEATEVEGTRVYLVEGETATLKHLIQGMLINSGNDAAAAIAIHLNGSIEKFSEQLNKYLKKTIGVQNTHFTNPHGLYEDDHYTTAYDLAIITNYAMRNPVFKEIFGTKELVWDGKEWDTKLVTHNLLLKGDYPYEGITGGKTGFVDVAKQTLATTAEKGQMQLTAIALKANYKREIYQDTQLMLDYGFQHFKSSMIYASTAYHSENKQFKAKEDVPITLPMTNYLEKVTDDGILKIIDANGEIIQTVKLSEKKTPLSADHMNEERIDKLQEESHPIGQNALFVFVLFALSSIVYSAKKWGSWM